MNHYAKGANAERAWVNIQKKAGAVVAARTAGSHSFIDAFALFDHGFGRPHIVMVQLKRGGKPPERERKTFESLAARMGGAVDLELLFIHIPDKRKR